MNRIDCFDSSWEFYLDTACGTEAPAQSAPWTPVQLPHDWQIWHVRRLYEDGTGWYRKRFTLRPEQGKRYALAFDGVYMDSAVFLNGVLLGEWKYGYTAFHFDLTDALRAGENEVLVRCRFRNPNSRWYSGAGIYRSVELWEMPELHLVPHGLYIAPREGQEKVWTVEASAEIGSSLPMELDDSTLAFSLLDEQGRQVDSLELPAVQTEPVPEAVSGTYLRGERESRIGTVSFRLAQPKLWELERPYCYRIRVRLLTNGEEADRMESTFGCRTIELTPDRGMFLNHRHVLLRGVCMHQDLGCLGSAFSVSAARRQLELLKEMGVNSIRTGHIVPAKEIMYLADELGILINCESFDCWTRGKNEYDYGRFFRDWHQRDVASWVRRDRNHPSLLFWCIGNEIYDTHAGPQGMETMKALLAQVALHDPKGNGVPTLGSNYMPWENTQKCADVLKVVGYNYGERYYKEHHEAHPDWVIYGSETGSVVQSRGIYHFPLSKSLLVDDDQQCSSLGNSRTSWGAESLDVCLRTEQEHPYTLGQYLWSGFDYIGEPTPYHTKNCYFGQIDTAGFPKDAFYTCQAAWLDGEKKPMVHLLPYWDFNEGQLIDICVTSNAAVVELWVNGVSQGRKRLNPAVSRIAVWQVPYAPGSLEAVAYDAAGRIVARDRQDSFGDSAALRVESDRRTLSADGRELAFLTISTVDAQGHPVRNANNRVSVEVSGAGVLLGLDNGDSTDYEEYKTTSRRLFSGLLLAVVSGSGTPGKLRVRVTSPGLTPAELELETAPYQGKPARHEAMLPPTWDVNEVPVRKLELRAERTVLTPEQPEAVCSVKLCPANATYHDLEWRLADDGGVTVNNAVLEPLNGAGTVVRVRGLGDGQIRVRCSCKNGKEVPQLISQLELRIEGMGQLNPDPYSFITGSLYDESCGDVGNGNERGVSFSRTGMSWVAYENLDFGRDGSDTVELPIFELAGEPTTIRFWKGLPYGPDSKLIGERIYHRPKMWNVYQLETFQLDERLTGLATFGIELQNKIHLKGFRFHKQSRAWDPIRAVDCDMIYGDSFQRQPETICEIGNNVSLVFQSLDFGEKGCCGVTVRGRSDLENNTIHLSFQGAESQQRRILEFHCQPEWGSQTFRFEPVYGMQDVTFLFLPGCRFDFDSFQFL